MITNTVSSSGKPTSSVLNIVDKSLGEVGKNGSPKGVTVFRVVGPHGPNGKYNYNHINVNSSLYKDNKIYQALNHKPVSNIVYNAAKNMDDIAKVAKVGGRAVAAVVMDGKDVYDFYKADANKIGKNIVTTKAGVVGSWAGGIGGAKAGAMGGAAIGTIICPGIGTAIGGVVGGLIGGIAGSLGGKAAGQEIAKAAYR